MDWDPIPDNQIICYCYQINKKTVDNAIENGSASVEELANKLLAGSKCKRCHLALQGIIDGRHKK